MDLVDTGYFAAFAGNQSLDLDGISPGTISQTFATTPGMAYAVDFAYSNNPERTYASHIANVTVMGTAGLLNSVIQHDSATGGQFATLAQMDYKLFHGLFTADSANATITFTSLDPANQFSGVILDAVKVGVVPTPEFGSAFALTGLLTAGGVSLWVKRRRKV